MLIIVYVRLCSVNTSYRPNRLIHLCHAMPQKTQSTILGAIFCSTHAIKIKVFIFKVSYLQLKLQL